METYLTFLTVFVGILTAVLLVQAIVLFLVYRRVTKLFGELEKTVARVADQTSTIMAQVTKLMNEVNQQASRYGQVGNEISSRVQHTVTGLLDKVERVTTLATSGATSIVRETSAALSGILAAVSHVLRLPERKRLPPPSRDAPSLH